jgi:hypothetical protein
MQDAVSYQLLYHHHSSTHRKLTTKLKIVHSLHGHLKWALNKIINYQYQQNYQLSISNLINIQRSQVPHLYSTFLTPRIRIYVSSFFTVVTVHIVIFWVVTVCSHEGGNHVSVKHVASIIEAKAGRLRMPLRYIC